MLHRRDLRQRRPPSKVVHILGCFGSSWSGGHAELRRRASWDVDSFFESIFPLSVYASGFLLSEMCLEFAVEECDI